MQPVSDSIDETVKALEPPGKDKTYRCDCGVAYPAVEYKNRPSPSGDRMWVAPKINPCPSCEVDEADAWAEEMRRRLAGAGIPSPLWHFQLGQNHALLQWPTEGDEAFIERTKASGKLGVSRANVDGIGRLIGWAADVRRGKHRRWLLLHGPVGVGKTTLLSAIGRALLTEEPPSQEELYSDQVSVGRDNQLGWDYAVARGLTSRTRRAAKVADVRYFRGGDLGRDTGESWEKDSAVVKAAKRARVLLLDELGTDAEPKRWEVEAVESLLGERSDHGLVTVVATNRTPKELVEDRLYGYRVADRLRSAVTVAIGGPSWR